MGYGDEIIASGLARGAAARGKRIAFGDGKKIIWSSQSHEVLKNNPNVARPGEEGMPNLEWVGYYTGHRFYATPEGNRWKFSETFRCPKGEIFFSPEEVLFAENCAGTGTIVEPRVKRHGACVGSNKQWPVHRYQKFVDVMRERGKNCTQLVPPGQKPILTGATPIYTQSFRHAMAVLSVADLYVGPEGGMHHASAALGIPAVVIFGGFPSPRATGYDDHVNLTGGASPCGNMKACSHCEKAMRAISVEEVLAASLSNMREVFA